MRLLYWLSDALRHRARRKRVAPDRAAGMRGEDLAQRFVQKRGMVVVARNYRSAVAPGEIDLIVRDGDKLVFIEVKARASDEFGSPDRAVDPEKQANLRRTASRYARMAGVEWQHVRFDIVSVVFSDPPAIDHFIDAFR
ncbi:MAG: YraN family protein [Bryobacteraceae bacterium]